MAHDYWFTTKLYGWGWAPATWEGWASTALYALLVIAWSVYVYRFNGSVRALGRRSSFIVGVVVLSALFVLEGWLTGEPPRWRWGPGT